MLASIHIFCLLCDVLETELKQKERLQIAREDFIRACKVESPKEKLNGSSWRRFSMRKDISPVN